MEEAYYPENVQKYQSKDQPPESLYKQVPFMDNQQNPKLFISSRERINSDIRERNYGA
jgi:hypothetical protein